MDDVTLASQPLDPMPNAQPVQPMPQAVPAAAPTTTKLFNAYDRAYEEVPDSDLTPALQSGKYRLPAGVQLRGINSDGEHFNVDGQTDFTQLAGMNILGSHGTEQEITKAWAKSHPGAAFTAAALRGASFGLSDVAGAAIGQKENLAALKEQNPIASTVGEIGGVIGSAVFVPGGGLVGAAGEVGSAVTGLAARELGVGAANVAGQSLLKRAAARVAGGAVEGGIYGLGQTVSEAALGDPEAAAQHVIANVGFAGLMNGALMGTGGLIKDAITRPFGKLSALDVAGVQAAQKELTDLGAQIKGHQDSIGDLAKLQRDLTGAESTGATQPLADGIAAEGVASTSTADALHAKLEDLSSQGKISDPSFIASLKDSINNGTDFTAMLAGNVTNGKRTIADGMSEKYVDYITKARNLDPETAKTVRQAFTDPETNKFVLDYMADPAQSTRQIHVQMDGMNAAGEDVRKLISGKIRQDSANLLQGSGEFRKKAAFGDAVNMNKDIYDKFIKPLSEDSPKMGQEFAQFQREYVSKITSIMDSSTGTTTDIYNASLDFRKQVDKFSRSYYRSNLTPEAQLTKDKLITPTRNRINDHLRDVGVFGKETAEAGKEIDAALHQLGITRDAYNKEFTVKKQQLGGGWKNINSASKVENYFKNPDAARNAFKNDVLGEYNDAIKNVLDVAQKHGAVEADVLKSTETLNNFAQAQGDMGKTRSAFMALNALESKTGKSLQNMMWGSVLGGMIPGPVGKVASAVLAARGYAVDNPIQILKMLGKLQDAQTFNKNKVTAAMGEFLNGKKIIPAGAETEGIASNVGSKPSNQKLADSYIQQANEIPKPKVDTGTTATAVDPSALPQGPKQDAKNLAEKLSFAARTGVLGALTQPTIRKETPAGKINLMQATPQELQDHIQKQLGPINEIAPNFAMASGQTIQNGTAFLQSKVPRNTSSDVFSKGETYAPPASVRAKFERYVEAVNEPLSVMKGLKTGNVTREGVEVLQTVYPQLYAQMQNQMLQTLNDHKAALTYYQKVHLSNVMGTPILTIQQPQNLAQVQSSFMMQGKPPSPQAGQAAGPTNLNTPFQTAMAR